MDKSKAVSEIGDCEDREKFAKKSKLRLLWSREDTVSELKAIIAKFLIDRLNIKLEEAKKAITENSVALEQECNKLRSLFSHDVWLNSAAKRASQIQVVTHSLKFTHPRAEGTSIHSLSDIQNTHGVVGSHCLKNKFENDAVGAASALDVYGFLKLEHQNHSFLDLVLARDADLAMALTDDETQAQEWITAFSGVIEPPDCVASHTFAKQIYWCMDGDSLGENSFHLLSPLHPTSLAHHVYQTVQHDRFSEEAIEARKAKKDDKYSDQPVREYPQMVIQQIGGSNPQNISYLNSQRRGENILFASCPPTLRGSASAKPLFNTDSMFHQFAKQPNVKTLVRSLYSFLKTDPKPILETRNLRAEYVLTIIDEFLQLTANLRLLKPGWSQNPKCLLSTTEKHWLDPDSFELLLKSEAKPLPTDTNERISESFAAWLNTQLRHLPVGKAEHLEWRKQMYKQIKTEEREGLNG